MANAKVTHAASIILPTALKFLAEKHNSTVETVVAALKAGHPSLTKQFKDVIANSVETAVSLHNAGKISLA